MSVTRRIEVGILGATGLVGQQLVAMLDEHPWFRLAWVSASERSAGKRYRELPWRITRPLPEEAERLTVNSLNPGNAPRVLFSALDAGVAGETEAAFAAAGHIILSNAGNHRMDPCVPLVIPEVNAEHLAALAFQKQQKGWAGGIITNPNCSTIFLAMALAALRDFKPQKVIVTTMQALSGAGYPGVASLDALGNVVPFIAGEEEKIECETKKILGTFIQDGFAPAQMQISAQTTRVPVVNGHTEMVSVELQKRPKREEILRSFDKFSGRTQEIELPHSPKHPMVHFYSYDRTQSRLEV